MQSSFTPPTGTYISWAIAYLVHPISRCHVYSNVCSEKGNKKT